MLDGTFPAGALGRCGGHDAHLCGLGGWWVVVVVVVVVVVTAAARDAAAARG